MHGRRFVIGLHDDDELVPGEPEDLRIPHGSAPEDVGRLTERVVADRMSESVIDLLEIIDIQHDPVIGVSLIRPHDDHLMLDELAVVQPGQRIHKGLLALDIDIDRGQSQCDPRPGKCDPEEDDLQDTAGEHRNEEHPDREKGHTAVLRTVFAQRCHAHAHRDEQIEIKDVTDRHPAVDVVRIDGEEETGEDVDDQQDRHHSRGDEQDPVLRQQAHPAAVEPHIDIQDPER